MQEGLWGEVGDRLDRSLYYPPEYQPRLGGPGCKEKENRSKSSDKDVGPVFLPEYRREEWIRKSAITLRLT